MLRIDKTIARKRSLGFRTVGLHVLRARGTASIRAVGQLS